MAVTGYGNNKVITHHSWKHVRRFEIYKRMMECIPRIMYHTVRVPQMFHDLIYNFCVFLESLSCKLQVRYFSLFFQMLTMLPPSPISPRCPMILSRDNYALKITSLRSWRCPSTISASVDSCCYKWLGLLKLSTVE